MGPTTKKDYGARKNQDVLCLFRFFVLFQNTFKVDVCVPYVPDLGTKKAYSFKLCKESLLC